VLLMDRTGWTDLQIAWADNAAAETELHDARNQLDHARATVDSIEVTPPGFGWGPTEDDLRRERRRAADAAERVDRAEQRVAETGQALAQVVRLTRKQFADQLGIAPDTLSGYVNRGQAPEPDGHDVHGHPWWLQSTADTYRTNRPGRGARTDKRSTGPKP
jgi:hypothetical protein